MDRPFIKGLELSQLFYEQAVKPILVRHFPDLTYSAALLGRGSEVLGFDTPQSMDHDWGPKLMLFLTEADFETRRQEIDQVLRQELPREIHGYPTHFDHHEDGTAVMAAVDRGPINHGVTIFTVGRFFNHVLNLDLKDDLCAVDWLTLPEQYLRSIAAGRVFHDGLGQLEAVRARLRYYPHDVWLYLLAAQWRRVSQEEAFMGRCGQVGDELGSRLVAARLVRDLMRLCFLMERQYTPYIKWFGSAFKQLECADGLTPILERVLNAATWQKRERPLTSACEFVARMHNDLGITGPMPTQASRFHDRPFLVIHAERFADAIRAAIASHEVRALPENLGSIDQFVDSTDVLDNLRQFDRLKLVYRFTPSNLMNDSLPKAILLDLDDTILALSQSADPCWQSVCERFAPRMEGLTPEQLFAAIKGSRTRFWGDPERHRGGRLNLRKARRDVVAAAFLELGIEGPALANEIADTYASEREGAIQPLPGAIEALRRLRDQGICFALITNGNAQGQRRKIDRFELAPLFDCIVIEGEFGVGKPDERVYVHALEKLNVKPKETWMVGDNLEWDVSAPQKLGIRGIWLDHAGQGLPESTPVRPDRVIRSLSELL